MQEQRNLQLDSQKIFLNEEKTNDLFMEWQVLLLKNDVNLNRYYFTEAFIDEIVSNQDKYIGIPITIDLENLQGKEFAKLGHNYSSSSNKFYTEQIGSYVSFEKTFDENNIAQLVGTARISKRNVDVIALLNELYQSEYGINLSVEVAAKDYHFNEKDWLVIDASPNNYLFADCVVSFPAEPNSKVLKLVSQLLDLDKEGGQDFMTQEKIEQEVSINVNELVKEKETVVLENETLKSQVQLLTEEKEVLVNEKNELEVSLNEANATIVSLGKEKETLVSELEELTKFKNEIIEKENTAKINAIIAEVSVELSEDEMKLINEIAETRDVEKVQFKVNELCAKKYRETLKLQNSKQEENNFFALNNQKDLGNDTLSKFNM